MKPLLFPALFLGVMLTVQAEVKLPALFADHMVLQRQMPVVVWGWAAPGEKVSVEFAGSKTESTADASGSWKIELPPLEACMEGRPLLVKGSNTITVQDEQRDAKAASKAMLSHLRNSRKNLLARLGGRAAMGSERLAIKKQTLA